MTEQEFINASIDQNAARLYLEFVKRPRLLRGYRERHHMIPRCFFTKENRKAADVPTNIYELTFREHCEAHLMLAQLFAGRRRYQMIKAARMTCFGDLGRSQTVADIAARVKDLDEKALPWDHLPCATVLNNREELLRLLSLDTVRNTAKREGLNEGWLFRACKLLDVKVPKRGERLRAQRMARLSHIDVSVEVEPLLGGLMMTRDIASHIGISKTDLEWLLRQNGLCNPNAHHRTGRQQSPAADEAWKRAEDIGRRFAEGVTKGELQKEFGIGSKCLNNILKQAGVHRLTRACNSPRHKQLRRHRSLLKRAITNERTIADVARRLQVPYLVIYKIIRKE